MLLLEFIVGDAPSAFQQWQTALRLSMVAGESAEEKAGTEPAWQVGCFRAHFWRGGLTKDWESFVHLPFLFWRVFSDSQPYYILSMARKSFKLLPLCWVQWS